MTGVTDHDLLIKLDTKLDTVLETLKDVKEWQKDHQENDHKEFSTLRSDINEMKKYAVSIAAVAAMIGAFFIACLKGASTAVARLFT